MARKKVEKEVEEKEVEEKEESVDDLDDLEEEFEDADSDDDTEAEDEVEDEADEDLEDEPDDDELEDEETEDEGYKMEEVAAEGDDDAPNDRMSGLAADVPVQVVAVLGKRSFTMQDLMNFHVGQVVELYRPANETVDLVVGGKLIAKGELVSIDGKLGVKIVKLI